MAVINTNISATVTTNALTKNERAMSQTMERLATGNRINTAADDAAGLAISQRLTSQIRGLDQAVRNVNDAISMIQTADGAAIEIGNMLQRMRELSVQATSATNTTSDVANLDLEFAALADEIDRIVDVTQWNGMNILDGTGGDSGTFTFQIGANDGQTLTVDFNDFNLADGGVAAAAIYTQSIDVSDYSSGDTIAIAGETYTFTGSETDLTEIVTALNASAETTMTPYTASASGTTLTLSADATGVITTDPTSTSVQTVSSTNTVTLATAGADSGDAIAAVAAVYTMEIDITEYDTGDVITVGGAAYTLTSAQPDLTALVSAINSATGNIGATNYTASASGNTLTLAADTVGPLTDPTSTATENSTLTNTQAGTETAEAYFTEVTEGASTTAAVYTTTLDVSDYTAGDELVINGVALTFGTANDTLAEIVALYNADTGTAAAAYTATGSGTTLTLTQDTPGVVASGSDPKINIGQVAVNTMSIDVSDYAAGDTINIMGSTYVFTGAETSLTEIVTDYNTNGSAIAGSSIYTASASGTTLTLVANAIGTKGDATAAAVQAVTITEATEGAAATTYTADVAAVYTQSIDVSDFSSGDTITVAGETYTFTGSETDLTELVTALNASSETTMTPYTATASGTTLTLTADTSGVETLSAMTSSQTVTSSTSNTVTEATVGAKNTAMGASLAGALSSSGSITSTTANIIDTIDSALQGVASQRATFGAAMNRLEYTVDNLANVSQNTSASRSRIEDADYAAETTELARTQIIQQAGTAMLSQANQQAQSVLALLK